MMQRGVCMEIAEGILLIDKELEKYELSLKEHCEVTRYMFIFLKNCSPHGIEVTEAVLKDACEHGVIHVKEIFEITNRGVSE